MRSRAPALGLRSVAVRHRQTRVQIRAARALVASDEDEVSSIAVGASIMPCLLANSRPVSDLNDLCLRRGA